MHASGVQPSGSWGILVLNSLALNPGGLPDPAILFNKEKNTTTKKEVFTKYLILCHILSTLSDIKLNRNHSGGPRWWLMAQGQGTVPAK